MSDPDILAARLCTLHLLCQILEKKQSFDLLLERDAAFRALPAKERGFTHMLTATVLRHIGQCDDLITKMQDKHGRPSQLKLQNILRMGLCQILYMNVPDHAAVSTSVDLCEASDLQRSKNFVNALLRRFLREKDILLSKQDEILLNIPAWLLQPLIQDWGLTQAAKIGASLLSEAPLDVTIKNPGMLEHWLKELDAQHLFHNTIRLKNPAAIPSLSGYHDGHWWVQDAAAALPVHLMGDVRNKLVFDLCAAPGGKTAQLAAKGAKVIALDRSAKRLSRLKENMERLSFSGTVQTMTADAAEWNPEELADAVLLDAPCSATGVIRRHPDILYLKSERDIDGLVRTQAHIFDHAATLLKPGGILIYCTCSILKSESEDQVETFLTNHPDFEHMPVTPEEVAGNESFINPAGDLRLFPYYLDSLGGLDGFFISRLRKK